MKPGTRMRTVRLDGAGGDRVLDRLPGGDPITDHPQVRHAGWSPVPSTTLAPRTSRSNIACAPWHGATPDVAEREQAAEHRVAGLAVVLADHLGDVVGAIGPVEADLAVGAHRRCHVGLGLGVLPSP